MTLSQTQALDALSPIARAGLLSLATAAVAGGMGQVKLVIVEDVVECGRIVSQSSHSSHALMAALAATAE